MSQKVLVERLFETLINGDRNAARHIFEECFRAEVPAERIVERLVWPVLEMVENLFRNDQMTAMSHHLATRLLRMLVDQLQLRYERYDATGEKLMVICGPNEQDEIAGQLAADMLEARGYEVFFPGGGVANDEIKMQIGELKPSTLVLFGSTPADLPYIRQLIDEVRDQGICPEMQIVVGGGVFNRAEGLAEEIGADLWARTPTELVEELANHPHKRASDQQRTVGRKRRTGKSTAA